MLGVFLLGLVVGALGEESWPDYQPPAHLSPDDFGGGVAGQHNQQEDHESFLGKERSDQFDTLSPEQSIARLKEMIIFIDKNQDKIVDEEELRLHLDQMHKSFIAQDIERNWAMFPPDVAKKGGIVWADYIRQVYEPLAQQSGGQLPQQYQNLQKRDQRRWGYADLQKDGTLIKEEYGCFMHPQNKDACPHMRDVIALEASEDMDSNGDGLISQEEFENFIYKPEQRAQDGGTEPEWLDHERKVFQYQWDKNRDGSLDMEELKAWIVPENFNRAEAEAKHLIRLADDDKDGKLQEEEMVNHYQVFVGSQQPPPRQEL